MPAPMTISDTPASRLSSTAACFDLALQRIITENFSHDIPRLAVALSGGLDSMVLLHLANSYAKRHGLSIYAYHVHHGLSDNADGWSAHCERECKLLDIAFDSKRVRVSKGSVGIEAAARRERYAALGDMARQSGASLLLTAHHQNDQVETVLLQLMRGSGTAGLSGMLEHNRAPKLLGDPDLVIARPLLGLPRHRLEEVAKDMGIRWVEDESNADPKYARNALRLQVTPLLSSLFPGMQECVARSAKHAQSAQRILDEVAAEDLHQCARNGAIRHECMSALSHDRQANLLRHWFTSHLVSPPSTSWLEQMIHQLKAARVDSNVLVEHPEFQVRRYRGDIILVLRASVSIAPESTELNEFGNPTEKFKWDGQEKIDFPAQHGSLHFIAAKSGISREWLRELPLELTIGSGGEKLKLAQNRPSRSLKKHFQERGIPVWKRQILPVVRRGDELVYAAGLGVSWHHVNVGVDSVELVWIPFGDSVKPEPAEKKENWINPLPMG